jgi:hypothetical protein
MPVAFVTVEVSIFSLAEESAARKKQCDVNAHMLFFNIDVIIHKEFVPPGQTIVVKVYCDFLRWHREDMRWKRPDKWHMNNWVLHHDNAPVHTALVCSSFVLQKLGNCSHPLPHLI